MCLAYFNPGAVRVRKTYCKGRGRYNQGWRVNRVRVAGESKQSQQNPRDRTSGDLAI